MRRKGTDWSSTNKKEFDKMGATPLNPATEILYQSVRVKGQAERPKTSPIYLTTAFNVEDLDDLIAHFCQTLDVFG